MAMNRQKRLADCIESAKGKDMPFKYGKTKLMESTGQLLEDLSGINSPENNSRLGRIMKLESKLHLHFWTPGKKNEAGSLSSTPTRLDQNLEPVGYLPDINQYPHLNRLLPLKEDPKTRDISYLKEKKYYSTIEEKKKDKEEEMLLSILCPSNLSLHTPYPTSIEALREINDQIRTQEKLKSCRAGEGLKHLMQRDEEAHLLLKSNIFKSVPSEFYLKHKDHILADLLQIRKDKERAAMSVQKHSTPKIEISTGMGVPSSRNDSIALLKWLNSMMDKLASAEKDIENDDKFELAQTVYYICYLEIIRQVSVQCIERGIIIWKLWKAYLALIEGLVGHHKNKMEKTEALKDEAVERVHKLYEKEMESNNAEVMNLRNAMSEVEDKNKELNATIKMNNKTINEQTEVIAEEKQKYLRLLKQYEIMQNKYQQLSEANKTLGEDFDRLQESEEHFRMRTIEMMKEKKEILLELEKKVLKNGRKILKSCIIIIILFYDK